jgi:FKBP-type peptidyl-prolyl cis-trans isomerase
VYRAAFVGAAVVALAGCDSASSSSGARLETDEQKASYGIGRDIGRNLKPASSQLDMDALIRGMEDEFADRDAALPEEEIRAATQRFSEAVRERQQAEREAAAEENLAAGEAYLAENGEKEGVVTTESGLQYEVLAEGDGEVPGPQDRVTIHYEGTLIDGTVFDSSRERGQPATFQVGGVIPGFSEGLQLMPVGSTYRLVIPGDLAYGAQGAGEQIGPNATLIFEVEMIGVESPEATAGDAGG